jgi:SAM-dependent methyltransferase
MSGDLVERLNLSWRISGPGYTAASLKQRLIAPFRRALSRLMATQESFNASVVQYVNADQLRLDLLDQAIDRLDDAVDDARRHQEALAAHERRMLDSMAARERGIQDAMETGWRGLQESLATAELTLQESAAARQRRSDAAMAAMRAENDELRTAVGVLQRATRKPDGPPSGQPQILGPPSGQPQVWGPPSGGPISATETMSHRYVGFEDQFRGSPEAIGENLASYLPIFAGASDVIDIGCGRGEFLDLLRERGVTARGIDLNDSMVEICREKGLQADQADALAYLRAQPAGSLGGVFAAQVVEHLEPGYLTHLLDAAFDALRPGSPIVLETINPACWFAFFESYVRDITHVRPLHPDTLRFLLVATGFQRVGVDYRAPYPEHEKLQPVAASLGDAAETLNANAAKLNNLLFTHLDYAATGYRP